jgi:ectoine hydroxylase-related dioxygenase (phytanoyl-CoA dioxygenase family)
MTYSFKKNCNDIINLGFTIIPNFKSKLIIENLKKDLVRMRNSKMRSTTGNNTIDSKLILTPHKNSKNFLNIIFDKEIQRYCIKFLNDPFYRSINKKYSNYSLNMSMVRSSGKDKLTFHRDDRNPPTRSNEICNLQFALAINKSQKSNGCTLCVPKSHIFEHYVKNISKYKKIFFEMKPGDLLIYDGRLWHSALHNKSTEDRWKFFFGYARWHIKQTYDYTKLIDKELLKNLKKNEKLILGFHAITKENDNIKFGSGQRGNINYSEFNYKKTLSSSSK